MVLEATMICIDNSEWIRNGDYSPTLFDAQKDAVSLICGAKTQANPENTVGVLTMAGKGVRVLVTPTSDLGMRHGVEVGGEMNLAAGIQVAQLALKHRQNKKQQQRIIVFVGSFVSAAWSSISQADYMALRLGFITTHQLPFTYDFHNCMLRSMEEEFRDIVGIRIDSGAREGYL